MSTSPDLANTDQYRLIIRLTTKEFSYYIVDPQKNDGAVYLQFSLLKSKSLLQQIEEIFYQQELLRLPYKSTYLMVESPVYSVVPNSYVNEAKQDVLLDFLHYEPAQRCFQNSFKRMHATNVFSVNEEAYGFLHRSLSINQVFHYITPLAEYFAQRSKFGDYSKMFVYVTNDTLDIFCFEKNRLKLVNRFDYTAFDNAAYFILNTWAKVSFDQLVDELLLSGDERYIESLVPLLTAYISRISTISPPTAWYAVPSSNKLLPLELMTFSLCE